jgi:uncharacterized protein (DUF2236 family)
MNSSRLQLQSTMPSKIDIANQRNAGRLFSPDSKIWQVDREMALLLAGGRALLLQLAHPKVAAGVAHYSRFQQNPLARLQRTMSAMWSIGFDESENAYAAIERVGHIHKHVHGSVGSSEPVAAGSRYDARDPQLLMWVHATLVDSAMVAYDLFVRPLSAEEKSRYYEDSKTLANLFEIPKTVLPESLSEFSAYFDEMLSGNTLAVGPAARSLAHDIVYPRPLILRPAAPLFRVVTAGLLPERLRIAYGLKWNQRRRTVFWLFAHAVRLLLPLLPGSIRIVPNARAAEKRLLSPKQANPFSQVRQA